MQNTTSKLVDVNGVPVNLEIKENPDYKPAKAGLSYIEFVAGISFMALTPKTTWDYKQGEINCLIEEWNESVLYGKDKLKESIEAMTKLNNKLRGENAQLKKELSELHNVQ